MLVWIFISMRDDSYFYYFYFGDVWDVWDWILWISLFVADFIVIVLLY